jgi:hypothetical protein
MGTARALLQHWVDHRDYEDYARRNWNSGPFIALWVIIAVCFFILFVWCTCARTPCEEDDCYRRRQLEEEILENRRRNRQIESELEDRRRVSPKHSQYSP